ncbi:MAG: hypothetical protein EXR77_10860 [Myxococcales bacterium]|nr:hypothetical protein [Myxococcales bacterium]
MAPWAVSAAVGAAVAAAVLGVVGWPIATVQIPPSLAAAALATDSAVALAHDVSAGSASPAVEIAVASSRTADLSRAVTDVDAPLRIVCEPEQLRVWANTTVRVSAEVGAGQPEFDAYLWHFEDGSEPIKGKAVEHTFAESVRDRHVTVQGLRHGSPAVVVSRRLPVERLPIEAVDAGDMAPETLPRVRGVRLLAAGAVPPDDHVAAVAVAAANMHADVVVADGDDVAMSALGDALRNKVPATVLLRWRLTTDHNQAEQSFLQVVSDPGKRLTEVRVGERSTGVWALGDLAIVPLDTRAEVMSEPSLSQIRAALASASAYSNVIALSARPLTPLRDGELIADRAYRLYEYALRHQVTVALSAQSEVFYDGRFGGLGVVGIGAVAMTGCVRLIGAERCQPASITVVEVSDKRRFRVWHLQGPEFSTVIADRDLPAEAGKVRR